MLGSWRAPQQRRHCPATEIWRDRFPVDPLRCYASTCVPPEPFWLTEVKSVASGAMGACLPKPGPRPQGGLSECCSTRSPRIPWEDYLVHDSEDADSRHTGAQSLALDSAWAYTPGQEATEGDLSAPLPEIHEDAGSSAPLPARRATQGVMTEDDVPVWATEGIVLEHVKRHGGPRPASNCLLHHLAAAGRPSLHCPAGQHVRAGQSRQHVHRWPLSDGNLDVGSRAACICIPRLRGVEGG